MSLPSYSLKVKSENSLISTFPAGCIVGGVCYSKKLTIRLVAGAWCLAAFVLVNSYSSTLISFVSASNNQPFIKSIYDIPEKPGAHLVIEKGKGADVIFSVLRAFIYIV
jgi:hypothetical protein